MDPQSIIKRIAEYYKTDVDTLKFSCKIRDAELVKARQVTMFFLKEKTNWSLAKIGSVYTKDHATVMHAVKAVNNGYDTNRAFRAEIDDLRAILNRSVNNPDNLPIEYTLMQIYGKKIAAQNYISHE